MCKSLNQWTGRYSYNFVAGPGVSIAGVLLWSIWRVGKMCCKDLVGLHQIKGGEHGCAMFRRYSRSSTLMPVTCCLLGLKKGLLTLSGARFLEVVACKSDGIMVLSPDMACSDLTEAYGKDVVNFMLSNLKMFSVVPFWTNILKHDIEVGDSTQVKQHHTSQCHEIMTMLTMLAGAAFFSKLDLWTTWWVHSDIADCTRRHVSSTTWSPDHLPSHQDYASRAQWSLWPTAW